MYDFLIARPGGSQTITEIVIDPELVLRDSTGPASA